MFAPGRWPLALVLCLSCGPVSAPTDGGVEPSLDAGAASGGGAGGGSSDSGLVSDAGEVSDSGATFDGGADAGAPFDAGGPVDGGLPRCPTTGPGAIIAPGACFAPSVADTGLPASATGAAHYALEPAGTPQRPPQRALVLYFASSVASPAMQIAEPTRNLYNAAASEGFHVVSLVHENQQVLGIACRSDAACYGATRKTVLLGQFEPGAFTALRGIQEHQGAVARLEALLRTLAAQRPGAGWDDFLRAGPERIDWGRVIAIGHSQGGGHAAYLGKLFALRRVVQLSSTCDLDDSDQPVPWTAAASGWATSPATSFYGFAAMSGDGICPGHVAVWTNMGMDPSRMLRTAATCGARQTHNVTIDCVDNEASWRQLLQ